MAEREVRIRFTGDTKAIKGAAGDVRKLFAGMVDDVDDARLAGDKLADAYKQTASRMEADLRELEATAAVVADSLGPEMTQAIEQSGRGVTSYVEEWRRLGLTFDDIKASSAQLADGLRSMDAAGRQAGEKVGAGLDRVSHSADQSRSVLANMVGNSVQDMGQLAGVTGSAGVMIGQLGEYAADGDINLRNLAATAGPLALLAVVTAGVAAEAEKVAKVNAFRADQVQGYSDALAGAGTELGAIVDALKEAGTMSATLFGTAISDTTKLFTELGLSVDDTAHLIAGGKDEIEKWADAMIAGGADAQKVNLVALTLSQNVDSLKTAHDNAAVSAEFFARKMSIEGSMMGEAARQGNILADAIHRVHNASINGSMAGEAARNGSYSPSHMYADYLTQQAKEAAKGAGKAVKETVKKTKEEIARELDELNATKFEFGGMSEEQYRAYLTKRLGALKKYSADWVAIKRELMALDKLDADRAQELADAKQKAADDAAKAAEDEAAARKKAAEEAQAAEEAERNRLAQRSIVAANIAGATYNYVNTAADPYAVINAIRQWERQNGSGWRA